MRKFSKIFLLSLLAFFSTLAVDAQTAIVTSEAPGESDFADGTVWFTMKLYGNSISAASSGLDTDSYFYANSSTIPSDDASLWCIVGDATNGYKFYNKSAGVSKVFAINNTAGSDGGNVRAKLVDATTTHSTENGADNWSTTFDINPVSIGSTNYYVSAHGASSKCLNKRGDYVSTWTTDKDGGSYVTFNNPIYSVLQTYVDTPFGISSEYAASEVSAMKTAAKSLSIDEYISGTCDAITTFTTYFNANSAEHYIKPSADKLYLIRNAYSNKYLSPNYYVGQTVSAPTSISGKKSVWKVIANEDGTYKLKNALSGYYIAGSSSYATAEEGTDFSFGLNGIYNTTCIIGTGTDYTAHSFLHANSGDLIAWTANAEASRWYFDEVSEDDYKSLYPATVDNVRDMLSICVPSVITASESDVNSFVTTPTSDTFQKILAASETQDGMYVRLASGKSGNKVLALSSDYTTAYANANSTLKTDVATIWQLVKTSTTASSYYLKNMNLGTYLGTLVNASTDSQNSSPMVEAQTSAIKVTFTKKNSNTFNVIDGNGNKMNDDGRVNYWTNGGNPGWMVYNATDIEVALHELGDASYATIYLPVSVSSVLNATAYVAKNAPANNQLTVTSTEGFAANAGVVLVSDTKASTATLTLGEGTETSLLSGTNTPLTISDASTYLVFGPKVSDSNTVGFYQPTSTLISIPANRAFYQNTSGAISLNFNGSVTGIEQILNEGQGMNAPVYDLTGRKVAKAVKGGLYIQNGKKFIVK